MNVKSERYKWGIDLGGTKIEGVVLDTSDNYRPLVRHRVPTEQEGGYEHIINQIAQLVELLKSESGLLPHKIGIGTPGTTDPKTGLLKNSNTVVLNGKPLRAALQSRLDIPVAMSNDANCFAMAETHMGVVQNLSTEPQVVVGLILGTGVGSGVVINGKVIEGLHGIGGEWGHNTLINEGPPCYCGKQGCVETIIAGPALEAYYKDLSGVHRSLKDIETEARASDHHAKATIRRLIEYFGLALSNIINILDPEVIVIGGGVGNIQELYTEGKAALLPQVFNKEINTQILKPSLGDSAGVFGAAMLV